MTEERAESLIRKIIKTDVGMFVSIVVTVFAFVKWVVLPIQVLQTQMAQMQITLTAVPKMVTDHAMFEEQQKSQDDKIDAIDGRLQRKGI